MLLPIIFCISPQANEVLHIIGNDSNDNTRTLFFLTKNQAGYILYIGELFFVERR